MRTIRIFATNWKNYLIDLGVTDFEKIGDLWKAIW
jgi:hypothetical protein